MPTTEVYEKLTASVTLFIAPSEDEKLKAIAKARNRSRSYIVREIIQGYLAANPVTVEVK